MKKIIFILVFCFILGFGYFFYPSQNYDFSLRSSFSHHTSLKDFRGEKLIIYFGYTFCPDICPGTLSLLALALDKMKNKPHLLFISLDIKRDKDPAKLEEWLKYFYPNSTALIAKNEKSLKKLTKNYGVLYEEIDLKDSFMQYSIAHSNELYLFDEKGHFKGSINDLSQKELLKALSEFLEDKK
ncbi:SCO family protein [Campylobacter upsaliensis]|uniref:SCO family protein n=1 Tax=Campylobacter upsaliensis TaxID=28080 RepID=UPI0022EA879F|nr:SCO family protein [Campylobacter upsaliensis]EHD8283812.1 SCO family protein [Campylobacter upsaliensis]EKM1540188.1 SCO family protein [Campylobacter upsaliensis]ELX2337015.1 SCO family protein [Campylobacter upsaliensis]HEC1570146.1 SCO family protein [Campylobacter upsaliensis]HEF3537198.1 SCO family protein [Campylobacter upsaliensis]